LNPVSGHYDSWHSDVGQDRLVALSLNLGREPFEGGLLQIRRADSPEIIAEIANRATGDAVIFRIDPSLRHRVGPVEGHVPRTAYAGWFRSRPDFRVLLGERLRGQRE
jgi:Rps23 Pro-64 3,4-dihydroxylase Tpa1-like proline 4-hydroxylase